MMSAPSPEQNQPETSLPFAGLKALICDDDELNQSILGRLLAKFGVESEMACNGHEGLLKLAERIYDVVFVDLQMPIVDGQQMAKMIRENSDARVAQTVLVAVTGAAHYFQNTSITQTSFDDYIVKPVTPHLILQSLRRTLSKA